jgi:hypothetical protein
MRPRAAGLTIYTLIAWIFPGSFACIPEGSAQTSRSPNYQAQAVYLYNLAKFVRWPEGQHNAVTVCVAGPEAYLNALKQVAISEEDAEPFQVRAVEHTEQTAGCDILFIESKEHTDEWLTACIGKPELTVSDLPDFLDRGGMIQLTPAEDRVRFAVDLRPVSNSGLSLSSELLKVATTIRGASGEEMTP